MHIQWPAIVIGIGLIAAGILLFRFRAQFAKSTADMQRSMYGKLGEAVARSNTPTMVGVVSIFWVVFGVVGILVGIFHG